MAKNINSETVERTRARRPQRRRFADDPVVYAQGSKYVVRARFSSIARLFQHDTGSVLTDGRYGPYCDLVDRAAIELAVEWQRRHRDYVFLRDELDLSVALDFNRPRPGAEYTLLGSAEHRAKGDRDERAIQILEERCRKAILEISMYNDCPDLCAVPPSPEKEWDLPTELVSRLARNTEKRDLSDRVRFTSSKRSMKAISLREKWAALDQAGMTVQPGLMDARVILVDDKYQSGTTAQFVASKLYQAGARQVLGLFCVKTLGNTDNVS